MRNVTSTPRVFISYARSDGAVFAGNLRAKLDAENIPLWQDRSGMEGGRDWWLQITDAIDHVEFMVLVMTPAAMASPVVRKEWRYARQKGVCVYPVKAGPDLDFASLPRWMSSAHFYDLDHEWPKFINDLNTRCQQPRVPFMVEDLPEDFVPREQEFNALIGHLLSHNRENPVAITAALRGAGGYGKTTLAKAICHNEDIQNAFDDGILWVTLGENPVDPTSKLADLVKILSGEPIDFSGLDATRTRFSELLADRDILLVIDDVWDQAHLRPFLQGGPRCARLITTRNRETLPGDARKVKVDQLREAEALQLLFSGLPTNRNQLEQKALAEFSRRLGNWPLLIKLANGVLRNRVLDAEQPLYDALSMLNTALDKRGLVAFDAAVASDRNQAVSKTLSLSVDMLGEFDRVRFVELAVFDEDVDVPLNTLEKYWNKTGNLDAMEVEELCHRLFSVSLLLNFDLRTRSMRLHDAVRHYLVGQHQISLSQWHGALLSSYNPNGNAWADVNDDGYLYRYLAYHLIGSQRGSELIDTLKDMRYLPAKTLKYKSWIAEQDLRKAQACVPQDNELRDLTKVFVQSGHLLNRADSLSDLIATLQSRLAHRTPLLPTGTQATKPFLVAMRPFPDLPHPALIRTLSGHLGPVYGCAISMDGQWLVSASADNKVKIWDIARGVEKLTLALHTAWVRDCVVSTDGRWIVSASADNKLKVWDVTNGKTKFTLTGHGQMVNSCALSPDDQWVVSASKDHTLKVWDMVTGEEKFSLLGHTGSVTCCSVSPDSRWIVSGSGDRTIRVWDAQSGEKKHCLARHNGWVSGCTVSSDGKWIVSASEDHTLKIWDLATGEEKMTLSGHRNAVTCCAISLDGKWIVSGSGDNLLKVWDATSGKECLTLIGHTKVVRRCAISPDSQWLVSASDDGMLKVWDIASSVKQFPEAVQRGWISSCSVSSNGHLVALASTDNSVNVWNAERRAELTCWTGHSRSVTCCAISLDGKWLVSASEDHSLIVWDTETGTQKLTLVGHSRSVNGCAISPDGRWISSASGDGSLKVWATESGTCVATLYVDGPLLSCAWHPDGNQIIAGGTRGVYWLQLIC